MSVAQTAMQSLSLFGSFRIQGDVVLFSHDVLFSAVRPRSAYSA
ncbi:Uncharacterised protein [Mycobacterium tuberculosis]|nr:Uncharacterised protein [Mycobacterium tuberculosis]